MRAQITQPARFVGNLVLTLTVLDGRAFAAGPYGVDDGWAVDHPTGHVLLTPVKVRQYTDAGAGWIRIEFSLLDRPLGHDTWDPDILALYDQAIDNARAGGLRVVGLIDGGSWRGTQTDWLQNSVEEAAGDGDNVYFQNYVANAVVPLVLHFQGRIDTWELWNEPNACTTGCPYRGGTYVHPSNLSWALARAWVEVHINQSISNVSLYLGGVFGHNIGGTISYRNAGAQYIDDTYAVGLGAAGSFAWTWAEYGVLPVDGIMQHFYLDQGGLTTAVHVRQYLDFVRQAYTKYEGGDTTKKTIITELGWRTTSVSQEVQASNIATSFEVLRSTPYVAGATLFRYGDVPGLAFGIVTGAGAHKLAYDDFQLYATFEGHFAPGSVHDSIARYFSGTGQAALGDPYDAGRTPWVYAWGRGYAQDFDGGSHTTLIVMSSDLGTFEVNDQHGLRTFYLDDGSIDTYGFPATNEYGYLDGTRQDFENGTYITWDPINGVIGYSGPRRVSAGEGGSRSATFVVASAHETSSHSCNWIRSADSPGPDR